MKHPMSHAAHSKRALAVAVLIVAGCAEDDSGAVSADDTCMSGLAWTGGDEESPRMHPGRDCIGCHAIEDEGPTFFAAGTVYPDWREPDECYGVEGITVELRGADGAVVTTVTNESGNFFFESPEVSLALPYTARLLHEGRERAMGTPQSSGACATCHTAAGAGNAPGRIVAP
jgi:hypothetical protein